MKILDLPFSFISQAGKVRILITTVGLRLPSAFHKVRQTIQEVIDKEFDLDISSIGNIFPNVVGRVQCSINVCENSDSLKFLVSLNEPNLPHLSYHVVVGVGIAESVDELVKSSTDFDEIFQNQKIIKRVPEIIPCLFVFTPQGYNGSGLPESVIAIPGNTPDNELHRIIKQGFIHCLMLYLNSLVPYYDTLQSTIDQPSSLIKMGSLHFIVGAYSLASTYYQRALKIKGDHLILAQAAEQSLNKRLDIKLEKNILETSVPSAFSNSNFNGWKPEALTTLNLAFRSKSIVCILQTILRLVVRVPEANRRELLLYAFNYTKPDPNNDYFNYHILALILLKHTGYDRTFIYHTNILFQNGFIKTYLLKPFADSLTSDSNWCLQRMKPATELFKSPDVPRVIKNELITYLLKNIHQIKQSTVQQELISLIPSTLTIDLDSILNVGKLELQESLSPIEESQGQTNSPFIYNAFDSTKKKKKKLISSVGEQISFLLRLTNPLQIVFHIDSCFLEATNALATPAVCDLSSNRSLATQYIPLTLTSLHEGELVITGFKLTSGHIVAKHKLPKPIVFTIIGKMPTLNIKLPFRTQPTLFENSETYVSFELINTSDVDVNLKGVKFPPPPAVVEYDMLPIKYPPEVIPPLPDHLEPGKAFNFKVKMTLDKSMTDLSFVVEYGSEKYTRRFAYTQPLSIAEGPHIDRIHVLPLDNHDDFISTSNLIMVVIHNPFELPIEVQGEDQTVVVSARSYGTYLVNLDKINAEIDTTSNNFTCNGISKDHIRKCEQALIRDLNRPIEKDEQINVWKSLLIKSQIQEQLKLRWVNQDGLDGILPFTHVSLDEATAMLIQKPPFEVEYEMRRKSEKIWIVTTNVKSTTNITVKSSLSFSVEGAGTGIYHVFTAGDEENVITTPGSFETAIHATPVGELKVTGKFFVGSAVFTRISSFKLSDFKLTD